MDQTKLWPRLLKTLALGPSPLGQRYRPLPPCLSSLQVPSNTGRHHAGHLCLQCGCISDHSLVTGMARGRCRYTHTWLLSLPDFLYWFCNKGYLDWAVAGRALSADRGFSAVVYQTWVSHMPSSTESVSSGGTISSNPLLHHLLLCEPKKSLLRAGWPCPHL